MLVHVCGCGPHVIITYVCYQLMLNTASVYCSYYLMYKELHFVAANCGEEVISMEAKLKADSLTPEGKYFDL